jgi:hypothetical protein
LYGQYLLSNKVQCQHHEFIEQYHKDTQPATRYVEFRYQFCTGLSDPQPKHEFIVFLGEYYHTFVKTVAALDKHTLFHEILTRRTPFPVRKPFYRTEESNSA